MPDTSLGITYPASGSNVELWTHFQTLAEDVNTLLAAAKKFVHLSRSVAVQSIPNNANTYLSWTHLIGADTSGSAIGGAGPALPVTSWTVPAGLSGIWGISVFARFSTASATGIRVMTLEVNGTLSSPEERLVGSATGSGLPSMNLHTELRLTAGDVLKIPVFQNSGGAMNIDFAAANAIGAPYFKARFIGA